MAWSMVVQSSDMEMNGHKESDVEEEKEPLQVTLYSKINLMEGCDDPSLLNDEERFKLITANIGRYFYNPPPLVDDPEEEPETLISLQISGIEAGLAVGSTTVSPDCQKALTHFVEFMWPVLAELEVDYFDNFLSIDDTFSFVNLLLSSPSLRRFSCGRITDESSPESTSLIDKWMMTREKKNLYILLPQRLFFLQDVCIDTLDLEAEVFIQLFERLATKTKRPRVSFDRISTELEAASYSREAITTTLTKLPGDYLDINFNLDGWMFREEKGLRAVCDLVAAIAESSASIRLSLFRSWMYKRAKAFLKEEEARQLFERVEGAFNLSSGELAELPNLKRLVVSRNQEAEESENLRFPEGLERLVMGNGFPKHVAAVPSLIHLEVKDYKASGGEMMNSLMKLNGCPLLATLRLHWVMVDDEAATNSVVFNLKQTDWRRKPFENLKTLEFSVDLNVNTGEKGAKLCRQNRLSLIGKKAAVVKVLLSGFQLPQLTLTHLTFVVGGTPSGSARMLSRDTLTRMIEGNLAGSLVSLESSESAVNEDAAPLLETLKAKVVENAKKLEELRISNKRKPSSNLLRTNGAVV